MVDSAGLVDLQHDEAATPAHFHHHRNELRVDRAVVAVVRVAADAHILKPPEPQGKKYSFIKLS